jgi:hypothetical protein
MQMKSEEASVVRERGRYGILAVLGLAIAAAPVSGETPPKPDMGTCHFYLPKEAVTIVYETYGGGARSNYRQANERNTYLGRQIIRVPKKDAPIFLVLSAGSATEWDLRLEAGAEVSAVLVLSSHHQIVSNVPPKAEIGFAIHGQGGGMDCPEDYTGGSDGSDLLVNLNPLLDREFSRNADEYFRTSSGKCDYMACGDDGEFSVPMPEATVPQPQVSFWSRLFGATVEAKAPAAVNVRTSTPLVIR